MAANVRVICRTRPLNKKEIARGGFNIINYSSDYGTMQLQKPEDEKTKHSFNFDYCFPPPATQLEVYDVIAKPILEDVFRGYNGTLFVYGQTGSGKTHTMMGPEGGKGMEDVEMKGVVPRVVMSIFDAVEQADENIEFVVKVSFLEIYMEKIKDLLDSKKDNLRVREDPTKGVWVEGATEVYCGCDEDVMNVLRVGQVNRSVASTNMNAESSRSHSICIIMIGQKNIKTGSTKTGQFFLVDLAGSEKVSKTGAAGQTLEEAKMINKSLTALGQVINALTDSKAKHIPYRDSKLTRLLQTSLGGNSRTTLCINCSPSDYNYGETLSTLRFGQRAKSIKNKAKVNQEKSVAELMALLAEAGKEIDLLKAYIALLIKEIKTVDPNHPIPPMPKAATASHDGSEKKEGKKEEKKAEGEEGESSQQEGDEKEGEPANGENLGEGLEKIMIHSEMKVRINEKEETLKRELEDKAQSLKDAQDQYESLQSEMERAQAVEEELKKQNKYMVNKIAELELDKEKFEFEKKKNELLIDELTGSRDSLSADVISLEKTLAQLQEKLATQEKLLTAEVKTPSGSRRRIRSLIKPSVEGAADGDKPKEVPAVSKVVSENAIHKLEEEVNNLRKQNQALLAEKMTLETVVSAMGKGPASASAPGAAGPSSSSGGEGESKLSVVGSTMEEVAAQYKKLEAQHKTLRQLTTQKFKEFDALKKSLLKDLQNRHEKVIDLEILLDEAREQYETALLQSGTKAKSEKKVVFLERSLEQLTQAHQKVVSQNQKLKAECEVAQKKIEARDKRIAQLEQNITSNQRQSEEHVEELNQELREVKQQLERLKDQNASLKVASTALATGNTRIAKPIRGGGGKHNTGFFGGLFGGGAPKSQQATQGPSASAPSVRG